MATGNHASITLIRGDSLMAARWKNGGGVTREVAVYPPGASFDTFAWRASIADVGQSGPFSRFDGIDRTLVLLAGAGMRLHEAGGATHALTVPLDCASFAGEAVIDARLVDGPTRDFNLMVRRGAARGEIAIWRGGTCHTLLADAALLFCAAGAPRVKIGDEPPVTLAPDDTLHIGAPAGVRCSIDGEGALLAITIRDQ